MKRRRLIVRGNVQAVGYRAFVKMIARNMRIHGSARNLDDGSVEIYCECPEETYEKFRTSIDRKAGDISDPMQMNVSEIEEHEVADISDEGLFGYPFDVLYDGAKVSPMEKEALERSEMAILAMTSMNTNLSGKIDGVGNKIDNLREKMDTGFKELGDKVDTGFKELGDKVDTGFKELGDKVDRVAEKVDAVGEKVEKNIEETRKVGEKVDAVGEKVEKNIEETRKVGEKVDAVGEKVEAVGEKVESMHIDVVEKLDTSIRETEMFREETGKSFVELDSKYHVVSEALLTMNESLRSTEARMIESMDNLTRVVDNLTKVVKEFVESRKR